MSHLIDDTQWAEYQALLQEKYPERFPPDAPVVPPAPSMTVPEAPMAQAAPEGTEEAPMGGA
ncbi:MAG TPA: hypothetical protein VJS20_11580 [Gemmatimonadales bacterium]|nr:hypothetical protein [Gemmatimonadales bacterium]